MSEDVVYYNQQVWSHSDYQISTSTCAIEKFVSKDKYNVSPVRLKISVNNFKQRINSNITLSHSEVFSFISKYKEYETKLAQIISNISFDQNAQETFSIKNSKKYLIVTFLYRTEYGGPCVRIVVSDKNTNYLDSEKVYMSIHDFLSFTMIIGQYRTNYLQTSDMMMSMVYTKDLNDKIVDLSDKLTGYYTQFISMTKNQIPQSYSSTNEVQPEGVYGCTTEMPPLNVQEEPSSSSAKMDDSFDPFASEIHDSMSSYLKVEIPKVDLEFKEDSQTTKSEVKTENAFIIKNSFTEKLLLNDIMNLEMYISNIANDDLPFEKFLQLIQNKLGFDALSGCTVEDKNSMNYVLSNYLKHYTKLSLEEKKQLPSSIIPVMVNNKYPTDNDKISLAYDLLLYSVYYTQLRNVLKDKDYSIIANKEFMCMVLKSLSTPLMFDPVDGIDEAVILSELSNRFRKYTELGVFNKLQENIYETKKVSYSMTDTVLKTEASRMIKAIKSNRDRFCVNKVYSDMKFLILSPSDLQNNKLSEEQIKRIITAEFNFRKNGKLNFEECKITKFDDIPLTIAEKYGVVIKKIDNTNLKRYVKDFCKGNDKVLAVCSDIANKVNQSYRDLRSINVDYAIVPEEILKAIYLWDTSKDSKITDNYIYYTELIKNSSLTKDMIISILLGITDVGSDPTFTNSFLAAMET